MEPFGPFWSPSGPRSSDGFGILRSRSDEIGNSGIIELFFSGRPEKRVSYIVSCRHCGGIDSFVW